MATIPVVVLICIVLSIVAADRIVGERFGGDVSRYVDSLPSRQVALVLGTSKRTANGAPNRYYSQRIEAAAQLYHAGKVEYLLVSGDNGSRYYNEPQDMKEDLIALGVPADRIVLDYAGFRTLDSVVRAWKIFGQTSFTIVSQEFHLERAMYIARYHNLNVQGFAAAAVPKPSPNRIWLREKLARVKMLLDLYILKSQPRFLGEPVAIR